MLFEVMEKAFEIAEYTKADIEKKFFALYNAFHYGATTPRSEYPFAVKGAGRNIYINDVKSKNIFL